jgi:hypothetical protein
MNKLFLYILTSTIAILISSFIAIKLFYKPFETIDISLYDGQEYNIKEKLDLTFSPYYYEDYDWFTDVRRYNELIKEKTIFDVNKLQFQNSVVIRSFETENNNADDFISYVNRIAIGRGLGYTNILNKSYIRGDGGGVSITITDFIYAFFFDDGYNWNKNNNFQTYYHQIFTSKTARKILFSEALCIVKNFSKTVPNDFRKRVVDELDILLAYSKTLPSNSYSESKTFTDYWKGFLYRRYFVDKIPLLEIQSSVLQAKKELNDLILEKDFAYELKINDDVGVYLSLNNFIITSYLNKKEIKFNNDRLLSIKHLMDNNGSYYQFTKTDFNGNEKKLLYDAKLNLIE